MGNDTYFTSHILKCRNFAILIHFIRLNNLFDLGRELVYVSYRCCFSNASPIKTIRLVCHKQRDIQYIIIQLQIIQRKTNTELNLIRE